MKEMMIDIDPEDNWAEVELARWQTDELPTKNSPPLDIPLALTNIADKIESSIRTGQPKEMITPFNLCSVLRYLAKFNYE